ncbi:MAG: tRNA uridine-5-carboxymethylaminomethyl(34) synthesis GTPase MnmE [Clostridia bacterium]|nr:tRNA uridine-5-carboxymethylaminomethyl(34) synthesis GTPase MnmE [Clostridia bacterium]
MSTIAAIATGQAAGGIGIVRISGENALFVADRIFKTVSGLKLNTLSGYKAAFGTVFLDEKPLDEAIATVFRAPKSYTGEDVVEISCHGGLYVTKQVLRAALQNGAVPAEAGEFTKRAFLNGKLDLAKAEAVMQLISAQGEQARAASFNTLEGALSREIAAVSADLKSVSASLAAWVDYPDEEIDDLSDEAIAQSLDKAIRALQALLVRFDSGKVILNGVDTAIVGKPNVGKSTLMNVLVGAEKSIVTDIAGTTRDIVEETVTVGNVVLRLSDTAGLRDTADTVERIGVERARKKIENAALVLALFDNSAPLTDADTDLFALCKGKKAIAVVNKTDLDGAWNTKILDTVFNKVIYISAKENTGVENLEKAIEETLGTADFDPSAATLMNERQHACCLAALESLKEAKSAQDSGLTRDAVNVSIDAAIESLDTLTGEKATESVVNEIFSRFCVGK